MAEPTLSAVLNAVLDLGRHFNERLDKTEARLDEKIETLRKDVSGLKVEVGTLKTEVKEGFQKVHSDLRVLDARLDEQRQTLNALIRT